MKKEAVPKASSSNHSCESRNLNAICFNSLRFRVKPGMSTKLLFGQPFLFYNLSSFTVKCLRIGASDTIL